MSEAFKQLVLRVGALRAGRVTWSLVLLFCIYVVLDVFLLHLTSGIARSSFDAMVRARVFTAAPDPRIVIIDIDEASLERMAKSFGRWPWPRDTLATVLDHVEKQTPAAIAWDIIFSDADRLSPGGDAAFNEAVLRSTHSHFSVVRLSAANDGASQISRIQLPGLWSRPPDGGKQAVTLALIPPVLPAIAASRLGYNNGYPDDDGILRRYRYQETLADGSQIQSVAASVASSVLGANLFQTRPTLGTDELVSWRKMQGAYPRLRFADVFAQAEGELPPSEVPSFKGKIVVIGATAPSLHDIHPTPLSPLQPGVESLATAIDNAINQRVLAEMPDWAQAFLAIGLCIAIAVWVQFRGIDSLAPALIALPAALLGVGYLSLNGAPLFLDLHLSAGLALLFLTLLRTWNGWREQHWCTPPVASGTPHVLLPLCANAPWSGVALSRLINLLEAHAPNCRLIVSETTVPAGNSLWPELASYAAIVGPDAELLSAQTHIKNQLNRYVVCEVSDPVALAEMPQRSDLVTHCLRSWSAMRPRP